MLKVLEVHVDIVFHPILCTLLPFHFCMSRITMIVVVLQSHAPVDPVLALDTAFQAPQPCNARPAAVSTHLLLPAMFADRRPAGVSTHLLLPAMFTDPRPAAVSTFRLVLAMFTDQHVCNVSVLKDSERVSTLQHAHGSQVAFDGGGADVSEGPDLLDVGACRVAVEIQYGYLFWVVDGPVS